jgi:hypothetical protein
MAKAESCLVRDRREEASSMRREVTSSQVRLSSLIERMAATVASKSPSRLLRNIITERASGMGAFMAARRFSGDVFVSTYSPMSLLRTYERVYSSEIRDMRVDKVDEAYRSLSLKIISAGSLRWETTTRRGLSPRPLMMKAAPFLRAAANSADSARELAEVSSTPVREERGGNSLGWIVYAML